MMPRTVSVTIPPRSSSTISIRKRSAAGWAISVPAERNQAFQFASSVLAEMQRRGISPKPGNYELWFTFRSGADPVLGERMACMIQDGEAFTPDVMLALQDEFLGGPDVETVGIAAGDLQDAADTLANQVAAGGEAIRDYGQVLEDCNARLGGDVAIGGLVQAVATLTAETTKAAERNRMLQEQLAASAARVAKLRQALVEAKQEATTDALTGIANRKAFELRLRRAVAANKGVAVPAPVSVLLLDIDHFKRFNDTHGHKVGDLVLRLVGRVLTDNLKGRDTAARYGGEEFAILLAGASLSAATVVGEQIRQALGTTQLTQRREGDRLGRVTVSVGVAQHRPGDSVAALVERADLALYRAKHTGRNRVCTERDLATPLHAPEHVAAVADAAAL